MRKSFIIIIFLLFNVFYSFSQIGNNGSGFYIGYVLGRYSPGLGNIASTTYLYNQKYKADFKFNNSLNGIPFGFRTIRNHWQTDLAFYIRWSQDESEFINPDDGQKWKLGLKTRYNTLVWGNAFHFGNMAIGMAIDIGNFKIYSKRTAVADYDKAEWNKSNIYGSKIALPLLPITGAFMFYYDFFPKFIGLRAYWQLPIGSVDYENRSSLSFYAFHVSNFGLCMMLNIANLSR